MEFLNPGLLGTQADFKRDFFLPIQIRQDAEAMERLRRLTGPSSSAASRPTAPSSRTCPRRWR
jgi:SNF2 family DNA or RNA helicase